jgi:transposase
LAARRIEKETGVRRETAGAYLKAAGVALRPSGSWGRRGPAKPANEVSPDPDSPAKPANEVSTDSGAPRRVTASRCEPFLEFVEVSLAKGRNAKAIWQDLVDTRGFSGSYQSVKRFLRNLRGKSSPEACAVIETAVLQTRG